ncbi:hypothetical protein ACQ4LE_009968 [Meloidogyne hapla]|uniref:KIX_2 domain-containing protein n=1 Tax=Meloidogyne hapla TaxID=6305 RepID=A0A1I8C208_MELHA
MPHFISKRNPSKPATNLEQQKRSTTLFGNYGTTACRLARHLQQFHRQHSSPAMMGDDENNYADDSDVFSLKSVVAWSVFGDIDTDFKHTSTPKSQSSETVNELIGKIFQKDMFNVFFSLAKDGANGTIPAAGSNTSNKEQLTIAVYKEYRATSRLSEPYKRLRNAIKGMEEEYSKSKQHNLIMRYMRMQKMIYELVQVEREYWLMVDIPPQAISETPQEYAIRIANLLDEQYGRNETSPKPGGAIAQLLGTTMCIAERAKGSTLLNTLRMKTTEDLRNLMNQLSTELYRLIHKYLTLRTAVKDLSRAYQHTRYYPLVPRYNLLKAMIKRIIRSSPISEDDHPKIEL